MIEKEKIDLIKPKPLELVEIKFRILGKISKTWLNHSWPRVIVDVVDLNEDPIWGVNTRTKIMSSIFFIFSKKIGFYCTFHTIAFS